MADVTPTPGWGTRFEVTDATGQPAKHAIVFVNEKPRGRTDAQGKFTLLLDARPQTMRIALGELDWSWEPSSTPYSPWTAVALR